MKQVIHYVVVPQQESKNVRLLVFKWNENYKELDLISDFENMFPTSDFEGLIKQEAKNYPKRYNVGTGYGNKEGIKLIKLNDKTY